MNTAVFVKNVEQQTRGDQRVYQLDPPLEGHEFVVVSAVDTSWIYAGLEMPPWGGSCETFIFPSDGEEITDYGELEGSLKGTMSHEEALHAAGYTVEGDDAA